MNNTLSQRERAQALLQQGLDTGDDSTASLALFRQSAAIDPSWAMPPFLVGSYFAANAQVEAAEHELATATLLGPEFPMARYQLGTLQFSSGRAAAALVTWQPILDLNDASPLPHFVRGYAALAQNDLAGAIVHFQSGLAKNKDNTPLSADIELVVGRTSALLEQTIEPVGNTLSEAANMPHVLFSHYQRPDSIH